MNSIFSFCLRTSLALGVMLGLVGCGHTPIAEASTALETECWSLQDTLQLTFSNADTQQVYQLYFPITFTEEYPYRNLYLRAAVQAPSGEVNLLPARFDLASAEGEWYTETSGDEVPFNLNLGEGLRLNQTGDYTIRMYHYMRDAEICGVREVGVVLDKLVR
ncbi:MAG: gliding motility lipoprotein GldH [Bacteroidota bacterium]